MVTVKELQINKTEIVLRGYEESFYIHYFPALLQQVMAKIVGSSSILQSSVWFL